MFSSLPIFLIFHTLYFTKLKLKLKYQKKKMFLDARCSLIFIENNSSIHYKYYISLIYPSSSFPFPSHFSSFSFCTETNLIVPVYRRQTCLAAFRDISPLHLQFFTGDKQASSPVDDSYNRAAPHAEHLFSRDVR